MKPPIWTVSRVITLSLGLSASGCMTIATQLPYWGVTEIPEMEVMVYGGTAYDVVAVVSPWTDNPENLLFLVESLFFLVDLPFSLAGDTILLPLTISQTLEMQISAAIESPDALKLPWRDAPAEALDKENKRQEACLQLSRLGTQGGCSE